MLTDIIIFIVVLALFLGGAYMFGGGGSRRKMLKRIDRMKQKKAGSSKTGQDLSLRRKKEESKGLAYWLLKPLPDFKRLGDRLERAGKTITTKQFLLRRLISVIVIMIICAVLKKPLLAGLFVGIIVGVWFPLKVLQFKINKRNKAFLRVFPDAIDLIVRGLRSGLPVSESMVLVAQEVPAPVGPVFSNISNTMKLGVTLEKALFETARKLDMTEFNFFTTSIALQRETGGNLSEILNNLSEVLRSRFIMHMKIKAMSSEARASAYIVGSLPFLVAIAVSVMSPDYIEPLFNDYRGNIALGIAAVMMVSGGFIMKRMASFEI